MSTFESPNEKEINHGRVSRQARNETEIVCEPKRCEETAVKRKLHRTFRHPSPNAPQEFHPICIACENAKQPIRSRTRNKTHRPGEQ